MKLLHYCLLFFLPAGFACCSPRYALTGETKKEYHVDSSLLVDSGIIKEYLPYKQRLDSAINRVIGISAQALTKGYDAPETLMGDFFCDALMQQAGEMGAQADFCLATKGGLRSTLPKGNITVGAVFEVMPFENELVVVDLTGSDMRKVLDFIAASGGQPVSGLQMTIRSKQQYTASINGQPFDEQRSYKMLTYDYLASGGDHLDFLRPIPHTVLGKKVRDALMDYIGSQTTAGKQINTSIDGRIVLAKD